MHAPRQQEILVFSPKCSKKSLIQFRDRRKRLRTPVEGEFEIEVCDPSPRRVTATMTELRSHGFNILYSGAPLPAGSEFRFDAGAIRGKARLMWSRRLDEQNESGCVVLPE